ncbi:MAG: hypothetical protein J5746_09530 [Victivallales bacterium]|nr:hypothetical protein [Victivallales bacterium]
MMKHVLVLFLLSLSVIVHAGNLKAVAAQGKLNIDGRLDEADWQSAMKIERFFIDKSDKPAFPTKAMLLYDANGLYVGFDVSIPQGSRIKNDAKEADSHQIYRDDCVEVMIDPNKTGDRYFHFMVNAGGLVLDRYCDQGGHVADAKWNGEIKVACSVQANAWYCEMFIPYYTLEIEHEGSRVWGFNFAVNRRNPHQEASAAENGLYHVAGAFLPVEGIEGDWSQFAWETSPVKVQCHGSSQHLVGDFTVPVTNLCNVSRKTRIDVALFGGEDVVVQGVSYEFKPGENAQIQFKKVNIPKAGDYKCVVSVLDYQNRRVLKRRVYPVRCDYAPFEIDLLAPRYRNCIFATQNLKKVVYNVKSNGPAAFVTGIRDLTGKVLAEKKMEKGGEVRFQVSALPEGKLLVFARASNENEVTHPLRKLPYLKGEVWIDDDNFIRVDGKRFFPIISWCTRHVDGINVKMTKGDVTPGVKLCTGDLTWTSFPPRKSYLLPAILPEHEEMMRDVIRKYRDNPDMFMYYLLDEPEIKNINVSGLRHAAEIIHDEDPYHITFVSNDTVAGAKDFVESGDMNGLHPYPNPHPGVPKSNFQRVVTFMDQVMAFNKTRRMPQLIAYAQQGFNYADFGQRNSRVPTYDEIRTQYLISIILGGRGVEFYTRQENIYPEINIGFPALVKELNALAPVILENDAKEPAFANSNPNVRTMLKKHDGEYWLFAVSTTSGVEKASFTLPAFAGKKLKVLEEERAIQANEGGVFEDTFSNYQVHIYTTAVPPALESLASIETRIAKANAKRRKAGNLAFQELENQKMSISASSNKAYFRRDDSCLWHVTDGVFVPENDTHYYQVTWHDNTPNKYPDWLMLNFRKPVHPSRAVIYPFKKTLKDFELQAFVNGQWKTLASVKDGKENKYELKLQPVESTQFRLFVTASNGPHTIVDEIELYEK